MAAGPQSKPQTQASIRLSTVVEMQKKAGALIRDHWAEIEQHKGRPDPEPDWLRYLALEKKGVLLLLAAFAGKAMIGYSVNAVVPDMHYAGRQCCANDGIYLAPEFRKRGIGNRLIHETEGMARKMGARRLTFHSNLGTGFQDLLGALGYFPAAVVYERSLDG
jgi:GNAT superfamily N-acetyltransferase